MQPQKAFSSNPNSPNLDSLPELITIDQFAQLLGISKRSVINGYNAGILPSPLRVGKRNRRFSKSQITQFLNNQEMSHE